ncbi:hypothetical protein ACFSBG_08455 [Georgenia yuyongxinii]|nr:hypothetical protein [Georgenia yuyongxinii]
MVEAAVHDAPAEPVGDAGRSAHAVPMATLMALCSLLAWGAASVGRRLIR